MLSEKTFEHILFLDKKSGCMPFLGIDQNAVSSGRKTCQLDSHRIFGRLNYTQNLS